MIEGISILVAIARVLYSRFTLAEGSDSFPLNPKSDCTQQYRWDENDTGSET